MSLKTLRDALPPYAADLARGLDDLADDRALSPLERDGCLLACVVAVGRVEALRALADDTELRPLEAEAAKSAAAVTTLNNIYYGAIGALGNTEYGSRPARLSETALSDPAVDRPVFELWCFAVSALNGSAPSMDAHEKELRARGTDPGKLQAAMKAAALVGAAARVLAAEAALSGEGTEKAAEEEGEDETPSPPSAGSASQDVASAPHPAPAAGDVAPG